MGFFKLCLVSVFQMALFLALFYYFAKWKLEFRRKVREMAGVEGPKNISAAVGIVFVAFMASFMLMMYEMSTLVLNKGVFIKVIVVFVVLFAIAEAVVRRLTVFRQYLLPSENPKYFEFVLTACLSLFSLVMAIEANFRISPTVTKIEAEVATVKPARLGSSVLSVKVLIPATEQSGWADGVSFFRYNSNKHSLSVSETQKLDLNLIAGSLGLSRVKALEPYGFLRTNMFSGRF